MTSAKRIEEMAANPEREYNDVPPVRFKEKDDFDREIIADNIIKLLDSELTDCYPMAIDGGWGTGKSEFCHKLINKLRDKKDDYKPRHIIYFDAFEAENADEPLLSLLAKIIEVIHPDKRESVISKIIPVALYVGGAVGKSLIKRFLKQDGDEFIEGFTETLNRDVAKGIDKSIGELLKKYSQSKRNINALKNAIRVGLEEKELVIFVDELDRCRPDFALNVFELVKHVFDIPGVKFIFIVNSEQIKSMIKNRYGEDVDTERYMEKFMHNFIKLPNKSPQENEIISNSIKNLFAYGKDKNIDVISGYDVFFGELTKRIFNKHKISLRKTDEIIKNFEVYNVLNPNNYLHGSNGYAYIEIIGIIIFSTDKTLAEKVLNEKVSSVDLNDYTLTSQNRTLNIRYNIFKDVLNGHLQYNHTMHGDTFDFTAQARILFGSPPYCDGKSILHNVIKTLNFCG